MKGAVIDVSVIMPTLAASERAKPLERALTSVLTQEGVRARPIVVVNGPHADATLVERLANDERIELIRLEEAGIRDAMRRGAAAVQTPWFGALDDDDTLLPGALATRLAAFEADPSLDIVVTNGYRRLDGADTLNTRDGASVRRDPLRAVLDANWLLAGSWLCRTSRVPSSIFDRMPPYLECTYLAITFALTGRMTFLDTPTVAWTAYNGESKTDRYRLGQPDALKQILTLDLPPDFRAGLVRHLAAAYHTVSEVHRTQGQLGASWRAHLKSLGIAAGWKYLPYTRHLLFDSLRRANGRD